MQTTPAAALVPGAIARAVESALNTIPVSRSAVRMPLATLRGTQGFEPGAGRMLSGGPAATG